MKQNIDEAAYNYATEKTKFRKDVLKEVDADNYCLRHRDCLVDFARGAEWQASQSPWISIEDEFPPYGKEILFLNDKNEIIGCQIFDKRHDIKIYCDWHCISYWALANFPEHLSKNK